MPTTPTNDYSTLGGQDAPPLQVCSDRALLEEAKAGNRNALSVLLHRHGPRIREGLSIAPRWRSVLEADDIMQVTYLEVFQNIACFRSGVDAFPAWLRRIAHNNLRDAIAWLGRDKRPSPEMRLVPLPHQNPIRWLYETIQAKGTTPSGRVASKEARRFLKQEVATLPSSYRRVLQLLYFEEHSVSEAADELQRSRGAIHLLRIRAIEQLRERFGSASRFL